MNYLKTLGLVALLSVTVVAAPPAVNKAAKDSTALVTSKLSGNRVGRGSAAYFGNGLFITNYHVIDGATLINITVPGTDFYVAVAIVAIDKDADIAVLKTNKKITLLKPVRFAIRETFVDRVWAAGYGSSMHDNIPGHFLRVYGGGKVDWMKAEPDTYRFAGKEGCSIGGDSGGPAFTEKGTYIGPIWGTDRKYTYAVSNEAVRNIMIPFFLKK